MWDEPQKAKKCRVIYIPKEFGRHPEDWSFSLINLGKDYVRFYHQDVVSQMGDRIKGLETQLSKLQKK